MEFEPDNREELKNNQVFINALWASREPLGAIVKPIFEAYEQKAQENSDFLRAAESALEELGIPYETLGRDFVAAAKKADLIVVDLYLGTEQGQPEFDLTVNSLKKAMAQRVGPPPSVVMMSQVGTVAEKSKTFRKEVGLHASGFRYIKKNELSKPGRMGGLIVTLATHRKDSHALAAFLDTWQSKAKDAVDLAAADLRRIDIDDLQHTKSLLLSLEGLSTSSYMLDVFDRILQYEIESNTDVIRAASQLDKIGDDPPPLTIAPDRDTFRLLDRTIFVNPKRRKQATGAVWPITFGDILAPQNDTAIKKHGFFAGRKDRVFFVASPECDMIRDDDLTTALLITGTLHPLKMNAPILGGAQPITPVVSIGASRFQVEWDFGGLRTITLKQAKFLLGDNGDGAVVARLRDVPALSLRQKLLSNVGRVGEMASPPKSFMFDADVLIPKHDGTLEKLALPGGHSLKGNCLVYRQSKHADLVFDQSHEHDLTDALHAIDQAQVAAHSRQFIGKCAEQSLIRQLFRTGLQKCAFPLSEIAPANLYALAQPTDPDEKRKLEKIGTIVTASEVTGALGTKQNSAGLVFHIRPVTGN
ncbi:MAG: hypothetical protein ABJQ08_16190 [Paracoccaceae bacterium]